MAVWGGLLYGCISTIPSLVLESDLPCGGKPTEEHVGESLLCAVNRSALYVLLFIQMNLCNLTLSLVYGLRGNTGHKEHLARNTLACGLPLLLLAAAYAVPSLSPSP
jgi:hypothetical protein